MAKSCSQFLSAVLLGFAMVLAADATAAVVSYDIVYVRQPRFGDNSNTTWPEVFHPARLDPGADLMLLRTNGTEELLVAGGNGGVNYQRGDLPYEGCDIYKIHLPTRQIVQLTFQEFTPNTGAGKWNYANPSSTGWQTTGLGYGMTLRSRAARLSLLTGERL